MRAFKKILRVLLRTLLVIVALYALVYVANRPFRSSEPAAEFLLYSHRGVHQTYHREGLDNFTCTAERIDVPRHSFLENTLPSIQAAFAAGADLVELDVHSTRDGELVVFHDWTVDCRTEGKGETRTHTLAELQALDAGYGYTADGGKTFPFRGQGIGLIPSLRDVLAAFPDRRFFLNQKDRSPATTKRAIALLRDTQAEGRVCLQAHAELNAQFRAELGAGACTLPNRLTLKRCYFDYLATGWYGGFPETCKGLTLVALEGGPMRLLWGWPGTFIERVHANGGRVLVFADDPARGAELRAAGFDGVFTDYIERWQN